MSLINDALKKAQRQRTGEPAPLPIMPVGDDTPAMRVTKRAKPAGFNAQMMKLGLVGGGIGLLLVVGVLAWSFRKPAPPVRPDSTASAQAQTTPSKPAASAAAATGTAVTTFTLNIPEPAPAKPEVTPPEPVRKTETPIKPAETPVKTVEIPVKPAEPPARPAEQPVKPAEQPVAPVVVAKPKPDPHALAYIDGLRVTGIRAAGADSKVLMNDRVYRINDVIERQYGLKLINVTAGTLSFEDQNGATYLRNF